MKKMNLFAALMVLALGSSFAKADVQEPLWNCAMTFEAEGGGIQLLVGHFELEGPGRIVCTDIAGNTEEIPVNVRLGGTPLALKFAVGKMKVAGLATGIGIAGSPEALLGGYVVGGVQGAVGVGAGAQLALHAAERAITLNAAVQAVGGLGLNVGFDYFEVTDARN